MSTPPKVLMVCSSGGHLLQLHALRTALGADIDASWVCFDKPDARSILRDEQVAFAHFPTNRHVGNLLRNTRVAWRVLRAERPAAVISTGAGVAVPFLLLARLRGIRSVYIESFARQTDLSLTGRIVLRFVDHFFVQSEQLAGLHPRAAYRGSIY